MGRQPLPALQRHKVGWKTHGNTRVSETFSMRNRRIPTLLAMSGVMDPQDHSIVIALPHIIRALDIRTGIGSHK